MEIASGAINVVVAVTALGLVAFLLYRLMRWARRRTRGSYVLGAVLTEVTQGAPVLEAKQGKKREEGAGDPPDGE
jgi:ABC-type uncharacterized transport system permease subunit